MHICVCLYIHVCVSMCVCVCVCARTGELVQTSGQQFINQWIRPHFWFVIYADQHTCNSSQAPPFSEASEFVMTFLNPDSEGVAQDHFGDDLRGEHLLLGVQNGQTPRVY